MDFDMAKIKSSEPGFQRFRAKCALTYPTRYFSPLEDEADLVGNSPDHHSTDNYLSSSPNSSSKKKVLAESVDSVDDEPLFPEPNRDISDCETSLSSRSYVKQVILNAELIFGTTPQHQALPVEDGFFVNHFLLNEHEIFFEFSVDGFRTCTKLPPSMTKEILIADIIDEVEEWT
ncbi:hypothetical protein CQW23_00874 [Capsicum baccatum]|uniref:Uncharacterized protein n=1 Tax=Capsicum baccatum TaxID=33114 RepID=A0A2G2XMC3_CAPBA|nr:hypothetical protein CQW23_00874 [Capsicum baccatum]